MASTGEAPGIAGKIRMTLHEWRLILQRLKKPDRDEYMQTAKITWLTILLIGSVAYIIQLVAVKLLTG
ncbi:hypothetical protein PYJP_14270 [Pyrofollis japonicus]|uniref:protein translocase SEC61 complex subunit gamma n=1 Tax=Pyrofollis japonicus TaxID=3060460 RepID=UPI00295BACBD|nr:protein translocase SEC61 complex subunit gamma [Pyrofollis japonicus]BEP18075.1 hypothetical protein PYJP_14270 [Pyrofollis japonicus]